MKKTPLKRVGKKTREWKKVRQELKKRFEAAGITHCEVRFPQCWIWQGLSFAHSRKRLDPKYDSHEAVLACPSCHTSLEGFSHDDMLENVRRIIKDRKRQP